MKAIAARRWRRALSPVPTMAALLTIVLTCLLGNWQLDRAHQKLDRAARRQAMAALPALPIGPAPMSVAPAALVDRPVVARGRFDAAHTVLLDNRPHGQGQSARAGFLVVTPLLLEGAARAAPAQDKAQEPAVLVVRGWIPRDPYDRSRIPPFQTPDGVVTVAGTALANAPRVYALGGREADAGARVRQNIDLASFAAELGRPLHPVVIQQSGDGTDGLARDWPPVDSGAERHYGYAFQWFSLAALTLLLLVVLTWRRLRRQPGDTDAARG